MFIIAGLCNPGARYAETRHNAGAWLIESLVDDLGLAWGNKFDARIASGSLAGERCLFVLPQQYMNRSGGPLQKALSFYKVEPEQLVVCHDELDLPPGGLRCKFGGSTAGHQGLNDIKRALGSDGFHRIRIGIGRPPESGDVSSWVLGRPSAEEREAIDSALYDASKALDVLLREGIDAAKQRFNRSAPR